MALKYRLCCLQPAQTGLLRMKTGTLERNGVSTEMADLIGRLIDLIEWPARRRAMGDVTMALLGSGRTQRFSHA